MMDEAALLKAAIQLDQDALTKIFDLYAPAIYKYALRLCHDPIESDSIVGDVFSALLEQFAGGKGPRTNLRSYLYQMAYHLVVDNARHNRRFADLDSAVDVPAKSPTITSQTQVEQRFLVESLISALNNDLNQLQRHVIILRFLEGFSLKETAMIINKKVNHVKVIQNRGIAKLRKSLRLQLETDQSDLSSQSDSTSTNQLAKSEFI
jgi:RNA polymerase sigma-70 factor (ECF subfamily)